MTDRFALGSLATAAVDEFGHLDNRVNNAGGPTTSKPLAELTLREWNECLALNFDRRVGRGDGGSRTDAVGEHRQHLVGCGVRTDIRVNGIAPGPVPTEHFFGNIEAKDYPLGELTDRIPLGLGTPHDICGAVV